jgi:hypothetical protein
MTMSDAKTGSAWLHRARGRNDSIENGQPEGFINCPLSSGIVDLADLPTYHHLNGRGSASVETLVSLIGIRSNDDALAIYSQTVFL